MNKTYAKCTIFDPMRYIILIFVTLSVKVHSQSDFGSSFNPTYGIVQANIPQDYYQEANGKSSEQLKESLYQIISNHTVFPYTSSSTDTWDILQLSDQDPENHDNIILVYTGRSQDKGYRDGSGNYSQYENGNGTQIILGTGNMFGQNLMVFQMRTIMPILMFII